MAEVTNVGQRSPADPGRAAAVEAEAIVKHYRSRAGTVEAVRGVDLRVEAGEVFGFLGPERRGQVDDRADADDAALDHGRHAPASPASTSRASRTRRASASASRCKRPVSTRARRGASCSSCRVGCSACRRARRRPRGRAARAGRARGRGGPPHQGLLRRHEAAARPRVGARARAGGAVPRRADDRPRPGEPADVWDELRRINERGTTVFLTTQYLEEADQLCDRLAIIDDGRIVREGTPRQLKAELRERLGLAHEPTLDDVFLDATGRTRTHVAGEVQEVSA